MSSACVASEVVRMGCGHVRPVIPSCDMDDATDSLVARGPKEGDNTATLDAISFLDGKVESMNETLDNMSRQINATLTSMQTQIKSVSSVFGE